MEIEGERAKGLYFALGELENIGRELIFELLAFFGEHTQIDDKTIHFANVG